jgi:hypothetical protein
VLHVRIVLLASFGAADGAARQLGQSRMRFPVQVSMRQGIAAGARGVDGNFIVEGLIKPRCRRYYSAPTASSLRVGPGKFRHRRGLLL